MALNGIPILDTQNMGDSLPSINNSLTSLDARYESLTGAQGLVNARIETARHNPIIAGVLTVNATASSISIGNPIGAFSTNGQEIGLGFANGPYIGRTYLKEPLVEVNETAFGTSINPLYVASWNACDISSDGKYIIAVTSLSGGYSRAVVSSNYGKTFRQTTAGLGYALDGVATSSDGRYMLATGSNGYIVRSVDYGLTWSSVLGFGYWTSPAISTDGRIQVVAVTNTYSSYSGIYVSRNYGLSWTQVYNISTSFRAVRVSSDGSVIYAVASGGTDWTFGRVYVSRDYGTTWNNVLLANSNFYNYSDISISSDGRCVAVCVEYYTVYLSTNYGSSYFFATPPHAAYASSLALSPDGDMLIVGGKGGGGLYIAPTLQSNIAAGQTINWIQVSTTNFPTSLRYNAGTLKISNDGKIIVATPRNASNLENRAIVSYSTTNFKPGSVIADGNLSVSGEISSTGTIFTNGSIFTNGNLNVSAINATQMSVVGNVSASAFTGIHYGDGSRLSGINLSQYFAVSGGEVFGSVFLREDFPIDQIKDGKTEFSVEEWTTAKFGTSGIRKLTTNTDGMIYFIDESYGTVKRIDPVTGLVTNLFGYPSGSNSIVDGSFGVAKISQTNTSICADGSGRYLYITDRACVRKIDLLTSTVSTIAGSSSGITGTTEGTGTAARFTSLRGITVNSAGTMAYITDNSRIRSLNLTTNAVSSIAGQNNLFGLSADNLFGARSRFTSPGGITINEAADCIYIADSTYNSIMRVNLTYPHATTFVAGVTSTTVVGYSTAPTTQGLLGFNRTQNPVTLSYDGKDLLYWGSASQSIGGGLNVVSLSTGNVTKLSLSSTHLYTDGALSAAQVGAVVALSIPVQNKINFVDYGVEVNTTNNGNLIRQLDLATNTVTTIAGATIDRKRQNGQENPTLINLANIQLSGATLPTLYTRSIAPTATGAALSITSTSITNIGSLTNSGTLTSNNISTFNATVPVPEAIFISNDPLTLTEDSCLSVDNYGNVYVSLHYAVVKITPSGHAVTVVPDSLLGNLSYGSWCKSTIVDPHGNTIYVVANNPSDGFYNNVYKFALTKTGTVGNIMLPPYNLNQIGGPAGSSVTYYGGCMDLAGNIYLADAAYHRIYKATPAGDITIFAGSTTGLDAGYLDGTGTAARFNGPVDIVYDSTNDCLYVADSNNHRIRKITCSGAVVTTYAGTSFAGNNVNVPRQQAALNTPKRLTIDKEGNLYIAQGSAVVLITNRGFCQNYFTGSHNVRALVYDNINGGLWFLDTDQPGLWRYNGSNEYYMVSPAWTDVSTRRDGIVSSLGGYSNKSVSLNRQRQLENTKATGVLSPYGTREIYNSFDSIRAETISGRFEGDAVIDNLMTVSPKPSTALLAKFGSQPKGIAVIPTEDTVLVSDTANNQIRRILPNRAVDTFIGNPYGTPGLANGVGLAVELDAPTGITLDTTLSPIVGYVSDSNNNTIRRFTYPHGVCTNVFPSSLNGGLTDAIVPNWTATNGIIGSAYDPNTGYTYVTSYAQNRIFAINPAGGVYLIAGTGTAATTDAAINRGNALRANINQPYGLAIDSTGDYLYIAESGSNKICRLTLRPNRPGREAEIYGYQIPGDLVTIVGTGTAGSADSATGTSATITTPKYMVIDSADKYLYFTENHKIRRVDLISPNNLAPVFPVVTLVGTGTAGTTDSFHGIQALTNTPGGIVLSPNQRYLYFTDAGGHKIRRVDLGARSNPVVTIAGTGTGSTADANYGLSASFNNPYGLYYAYDEPNKGNVSTISEQLLVADYGNHRIRSIRVNNPHALFDASSVNQKVIALSGATQNFTPQLINPQNCPISVYNPLWFVNFPAAAANYFTHHIYDRSAQGDNILTFANEPFTLESWVYFLAAPTNAAPQVLASVRTMNPLSGLAVRFEVGDQLTVRLGVSAYNSGVAHGMAINTWNHVCYMRPYSGGPVEFYVNGVLKGSNPFTATGWISGNLFVYPSQLGWINDQYEPNASCIGSDFGTASTQGYLSQFRSTYGKAIYNTDVKRFSPQKFDFTGWTGDNNRDYAWDREAYTGGALPFYQPDDPTYWIRTLMFTTSAVGEMSPGYSTGGGYPRTWTKTGTSGNMLQSTPGAFNPYTAAGAMGVYFDGSFYFEGNNAAYSMGTGNFTIELWAYTASGAATCNTTFISIGDVNRDGVYGKEIRIGQSMACGGFGIMVPSNTNDSDAFYYGNTLNGNSFLLNQWQHLALVRNGSNIALFRNGIPEVSATGISFNHASTSTFLRIGASQWAGDGNYTGALSQVRVTKGKALYTSTFTLPTMYGAAALLTPTTNGAATGGTVAPVLGDVVFLGMQNVGYTVTTVGGTVAGTADGNTGVANQVTFNGPIHFNLTKYGSSSNSTKTLSLVEYGSSRIRQLETTNSGSTYNVTTLYSPTTLNGAATFKNPHGLFFQNTNDIYVADKDNHGIKRINPNTGEAMTVAGALDGGAGYINFCNLGKFYNQHGLARDNTNNILYVADRGNHTIRAITIDSVVTTVAGAPGIAGFADGIGSAARFNDPVGIAINAAGTELYVADRGNHCIRRIITATRAVSTVAGQPGVAGQLSLSAVPGYNALFDAPHNIVADATTNLYVTNDNTHTIYKVALAANGTQPAGTVSFMAGNSAVAEAGAQDGIRSFARFNNPFGMVISGNSLFIADISNHTIRKLDIPTYTVTTLAGQPGIAGFTDAATGGNTQFNRPHSLIIDNAATPALYVCDRDNNAIRRVLTTTGQTSTVYANTYQDNIFTYFNPNLGTTEGVALSTAYYENPTCIAGNAAGTEIYMTVPGWHLIAVLSATALPQRIIKQFAGGYVESGTTDTPSNSAILIMQYSQRLRSPSKVVNTTTGLGYICDTGNHTIRRINYTTGRIDNFAGNGTPGFADHYGVGARFNTPTDIVIQSNGDLIVADTGNKKLRRITPAGLVTTVAGVSGAANIDFDGALGVAGVTPLAMWTDGATNLTFTENETSKVKRWFGGTSTINTIAGTQSSGSSNSPAALYPLTKNYIQLPTPASGFVALDLTQAYMFRVLMNAATITFAFNFPRVSKIHDFMIQTVGDGTARTVVWPSNVKWGTAFSTTRGTAPAVSSTLNYVDTYEFITYDGGITWFGRGFQQQG